MDFKNNFQLDPAAFSGQTVVFGEGQQPARYIQPPSRELIPVEMLKYSDAAKLAHAVELRPNMVFYCIVAGTFIFGDFIEAFLTERRIVAEELTISTLSLNQNNVDSLAGLLAAGYIKKLNLIISGYFYSHELHRLVPYIYKHLDDEAFSDRFQLAVADTHCKTTLIRTSLGHHITMHGSANLRSSSSVEQFCIEERQDLYEFNQHYQNQIIAEFKTINHDQPRTKLKRLRDDKLWQIVQQAPNPTTPAAQ